MINPSICMIPQRNSLAISRANSRIVLLVFALFTFLYSGIGQPEIRTDHEMVRKYREHCHQYYEVKGEAEKGDSVSGQFLVWSKSKNIQTRFIALYNFYLFKDLSYTIPEEHLKYAEEILELSRMTSDELNILKARQYAISAYIMNGRLSLARETIQSMPGESPDPFFPYFKGLAMLEEAKILQLENNKNLSLTTYLDAIEYARENDNDSLLSECYARIARFYKGNGLYQRSREYGLLQREMSLKVHDSDQFAWVNYKILSLSNAPGSSLEMDSAVMFGLIRYARRKELTRLVDYSFALYRTYLINNGKYRNLEYICKSGFREEFGKLKSSRPHIYFRIKALIMENNREIDSALIFYEKTEDVFESEWGSSLSDYEWAHFKFRYAEFLERIGKMEEAIDYYRGALVYFQNDKKKERASQICRKLQDIFSGLGNFKEAFKYAQLERIYGEIFRESVKKDELMRLELEHEVEKRENETTREIEKRKNQLLYFLTGLSLVLVFSMLIYRQYRKTKDQKKISDDLLLNILPGPTADELKARGKTTARRYENATVLFLDIKNFTGISSRLSPEELVNELDVYIQAYDQITERYGLEKIKTIGDAYLAVGGVPENNRADASLVVQAAIAMVKTTKQISGERSKNGKPEINVRIGCNTGPVVAGVVGSKKFQFDIWGDTVNVAARLEQNSVAGKINISRSTRDALGDAFETEFRGEIEARNKGRIEMYFVKFS